MSNLNLKILQQCRGCPGSKFKNIDGKKYFYFIESGFAILSACCYFMSTDIERRPVTIINRYPDFKMQGYTSWKKSNSSQFAFLYPTFKGKL